MGTHDRTPVDLEQLAADLERARSDFEAARRRVTDLEQLFKIAQRQYGNETGASGSWTPADLFPTTTGDLARAGAREAARNVLQDSRARMTAEEVAKQMELRGWTSRSEDPLGVVRSTLIRLQKEEPEVQRVGHGVYQWREGTKFRLT